MKKTDLEIIVIDVNNETRLFARFLFETIPLVSKDRHKRCLINTSDMKDIWKAAMWTGKYNNQTHKYCCNCPGNHW